MAATLGSHAPSPAGLLTVLGRYPIARGQQLILLQLDRRVLLLSQCGGAGGLGGIFGLQARRGGGSSGGGTLATLSEITDPDEVASIIAKTRETEGQSIGEKFRAMMRGFEAAPSGDDQDWSGRHVQRSERAGGESGSSARTNVRSSSEGDVVELWDERTSNLVAPATVVQARTEPAATATITPAAAPTNPLHAIDALRRRLSSFSVGAERGRVCKS